MANVNIPVTIQIRNAEFQKLASDQIRKQLSKDIASAVSSTGNLTKEFKDATASADAFTGRIATIARLINRGFTFKDRNVKAYFDTLTEGGKAAVSRLVTLQSAINKLQTGKISANAFNKILNAQVLPDPLDNSDRAKAFRSLVNSTVTAAALDYERLTKTVERETKKQTEIQIKEEQKRKRALENLRQKTVGDSVSADLFRERSSGNSRVSNLRSDITSRLNAEVQAEQKAADDYVQNSNFITQQVEKAKAELRKAFDAREQTRQDQAGKAAQTESKILQEADKTRAANLKDDIKNRYAILNKEEQAAFARQLDAVRNVALTSGNEARSIFQEAKRQAASLVRSGIISQEDFDVINRRFSEIAAKVQEINRIKAKDSDQGTIAAIGADGNALAREVQNGRDLVNTLNQAKTAAEQRAVAQKEQEASAKRLATLEERNNEIYRQRISVIEKQQALARETIAIANANGRLANNPSEELRRLERFASADPRSLVAVAPPGGGPPRPPVVGGGPEDFFSDDDAARRTVSRLRSVVAQQAKFNGIVQRFGELTGLAAKRYGAFLLGTFAITRLTSAFAAANQEALQFEKLIGRLSQTIRVFNDTLDQARSRGLAVGDAILEAARRTGVASNEIAQGVVEIAQAGNEQLGALQFVADQLANTQLSASFDDIKSTAEGLIAVQGQFNLQLSDTGNLLDKINQVSVEYAVESGNFFEAVKRGGATFAGLGGTFEEFIEYLTLIRSATRETAPTLGVFFKTGLGRLSKSAQQQIFQEFGVDAPGQGRSVIDQLRDLANAQSFQQLSDTERIRTTIALFGAQQAGRGEALLRELGKESGRDRTVQDVIGESTGSVGRDIKIVEEDVNRSIGRITQSFQSFFNVLLQDQSVRRFFTGLADFFTSIASFASNNRDTLNFIVRLTAAVGLLAVSFQGLRFVQGLKLGLTGGVGSPDAAGGFNIGSRIFNRRNLATAGAVGGIAALGIGGFINDRIINEAGLNGSSVTQNQRLLSGGLNGAALGASVGLLVGPIGAAIGAATGGLIGAIIENSKIIKENTQKAFKDARAVLNINDPSSVAKFATSIRSGLLSENVRPEDVRQFRLGETRDVLSARASNLSVANRLENNATIANLLKNNQSDFVSILSDRLKGLSFSESDLTSQKAFEKSLRDQLTATAEQLLNPGGAEGLSKNISDFVDKFFDTINPEKEFQKNVSNRVNRLAAELVDGELFTKLITGFEAIANTLNQSSDSLKIGFDKILNGLDGFVTDINSVREVRVPRGDVFSFSSDVNNLQQSITNTLTKFISNPTFINSLREAAASNTDLQATDSVDALQSPDVAVARILGSLSAVGDISQQEFTDVFRFLRGFTDNLSDAIAELNKLSEGTQSVRQFVSERLGTEDVQKILRDILENQASAINARANLERSFNDSLRSIYQERNALEIESNRSRIDLLESQNSINTNFGLNDNNSINIGREIANIATSILPSQEIVSEIISGLNLAAIAEPSLRRIDRTNPSLENTAELNSVVEKRLTLETALGLAVDNLTESISLSARAVDIFTTRANAIRSSLQSIGQRSISGELNQQDNTSNALLLRNLLTTPEDDRLRNRENSRRRAARNTAAGGSLLLDNSLPASSDFNVGVLNSRFGGLEQEQQKRVIEILRNIGDFNVIDNPSRTGPGGNQLTGNQIANQLEVQTGVNALAPIISTLTGRALPEVINELTSSLTKNQREAEEARKNEIAARKLLLEIQDNNNKLLSNQTTELQLNTNALKEFNTGISVLSAQINNLFTKLPEAIEKQVSGAANPASSIKNNMSVEIAPVEVNVNINDAELLRSLSPLVEQKVYEAIGDVMDRLADTEQDNPSKAANIRAINIGAKKAGFNPQSPNI